MKRVMILTLGLALFTACQATPIIKKDAVEKDAVEKDAQSAKSEKILIPKESQQLLMVTTNSWSDKKGVLQRFERLDEHWRRVGKPIEIILGRNGLGWGIGLHLIPPDAKFIKKEGDGKAPAGLFSLGNGFGYDELKIDFPYSVYKRTDHCVDDSQSIFYNRIIDSTMAQKDYKSFEHMKLKNRLYKYGITVNHNENQVPMAGSCIFIHIRSDSNKGTAGCTAMKESEIRKILRWIKVEKKPLLLQLPRTEVVKKIADNSLL